jgi:hypothetical protein
VKARKTFDQAIGEHGVEPILASARRWAAAREPRFLPEPVKFLSGAWKANPQPAGTGGNSGTTYHAPKKPTPAEVMAGLYQSTRRRDA